MAPTSPRGTPDLLRQVAADQAEVVSRGQLRAAGYGRDHVRRAIAARRWQLLGLAIVLHAGEPTWRQREWAAILTAPSRAALAGRAGAQQHGLRGFKPAIIDVVVPASDAPVPMPGVRWHRSRRFDEFDVNPALAPPTLQRPRALLDAASREPTARIGCAILAAAVQQRLITATWLRRELLASGPVRHRSQLLAVLADIAGGAESLAEIDFVKLARKAGLPPPIRQSFRLDAAGRRRYLDVDFGTFCVEVDGGVHLNPLNAWDDAHRQNDLVLIGERILRFPSVVVRLQPELVVAQLRAAARLFGVACGRC
jgi:hypothetical protein